eukprot:TRINITY_DN69919_c0_g1_i1.p1 TRINITY_DN69919_c0_g1~~TRINITY_DN69919_c0_g1_i1.p1  ORF type:complete len:428 (+),score=55.22 TRINITY_DN69919_c0_g1_i1:45-1328(+)
MLAMSLLSTRRCIFAIAGRRGIACRWSSSSAFIRSAWQALDASSSRSRLLKPATVPCFSLSRHRRSCNGRRAFSDKCRDATTAELPTVAVIADVSTAEGISLLNFTKDETANANAKFLVANSLDSFVTSYGTDVLQNVTAMAVMAVGAAAGSPQLVSELWPHCPNVRWVHSLSSGVDSLAPVLRSLPRIGDVQVTNAKGAFSRSLAEYALMAMLHFNKQIPRCQSNKQAKRWDKYVMNEMHGKTVGFVGFGDIAKTTVPLCRAFGMHVIALRQNKGTSGEAVVADETFGVDDAAERLELFRRSDFVLCSLPSTLHTQHFCSVEEFAAMRRTGVFISIGRGCCVDEAALVEALRSGSIAGAALDVFEKEPLPVESSIWDCPNLLLTAHNANHTESYMHDALNQFLEMLGRFSKAPDEFKGTVSLERGY